MLCRDEARIDQQVAKLNGVVVNLLSDSDLIHAGLPCSKC